MATMHFCRLPASLPHFQECDTDASQSGCCQAASVSRLQTNVRIWHSFDVAPVVCPYGIHDYVGSHLRGCHEDVAKGESTAVSRVHVLQPVLWGQRQGS